MPKVYISLGSNLKDREQNLQTALSKLEQFTKITKKSQIYETEPVEYKNQPQFLNMTVEIETDLTPHDLLDHLHEIEHKMGRKREEEIKKGPRIIDLDILFFGNQIIDEPDLKIPHPEIENRNFVLTPLTEINENLIHPIFQKTVKTLKEELKNPEKVKLWI